MPAIKNDRFIIRTASGLKQQAQAEAKRRGQSLSAFVRDAICQANEQKTHPPT